MHTTLRILVLLLLAAPAMAQDQTCPDSEMPEKSLSDLLSTKSDREKQKAVYDTFRNAPRIFLTISLIEPMRSERLETILKEGDDPNACGPGDWKPAALLLKYGASPDSPTTSSGITALSLAISTGKLAFARQLIAAGADVQAKSQWGATPLIDLATVYVSRTTASDYDVLRFGQLLIDKGVPINAQMSTGTTALMMAALANNAELVKALIAWGADVNLRNKRGETAISFAKKKGYTEIVSLLIGAGAKES